MKPTNLVFSAALIVLLSSPLRPAFAQDTVRIEVGGSVPLTCEVQIERIQSQLDRIFVNHYCNTPHVLRAVLIDPSTNGPWSGFVSYRGQRAVANEFGQVEFFFPDVEQGRWILQFRRPTSPNGTSSAPSNADASPPFVSVEIVPR